MAISWADEKHGDNMLRREHPGWSSDDIRALINETIEELSLLTEGQHGEHMIEIDDDTEQLVPITDRIMERYTKAHIGYYSESTNEDFAADLTPKVQ